MPAGSVLELKGFLPPAKVSKSVADRRELSSLSTTKVLVAFGRSSDCHGSPPLDSPALYPAVWPSVPSSCSSGWVERMSTLDWKNRMPLPQLLSPESGGGIHTA